MAKTEKIYYENSMKAIKLYTEINETGKRILEEFNKSLIVHRITYTYDKDINNIHNLISGIHRSAESINIFLSVDYIFQTGITDFIFHVQNCEKLFYDINGNDMRIVIHYIGYNNPTSIIPYIEVYILSFNKYNVWINEYSQQFHLSNIFNIFRNISITPSSKDTISVISKL